MSLTNIADVRGVLLDIEGTTTPIVFVHEVLFSYARSNVRSLLTQNFDSPDWQADLKILREENEVDLKQNPPPPAIVEGPADAQIESILAYVNWLMDRDRKSTGLKSLQGRIWKQGYLDGTLKAKVFSDVAPAMERWQRAGVKISIFSSGSALAQRLLFAHTEAGDLTKFIDGYFDTTIGSKKEAESYRKIVAELKLPATKILFVSDLVAELDAASIAGMQTLLCLRAGNHPQSDATSHKAINSLEEISD